MITPCSKLWTDINLNVHRKEVVNCCKRSQVQSPTVEEISDPNFWTDRKELVDARRFWAKKLDFPKGCEACSTNHPNSSYNSWNEWLGKPTPNLKTNHVYKIEIALSSTCNQTCLYCIPEVSSLWAKKLGVPILEPDTEWRDAALKSLFTFIENNTTNKDSMLYTFLGGETFLEDGFLEIIEKLASIHQKNNQRCVMHFISNLNLGPSVLQNFINICKRYPNVVTSLGGSLENLGKRAEALREGLSFKRFEENFEWLLSENCITKVGLLPTMNALSVADHTEYLEWGISKISKYRKIQDIGKTWTMVINTAYEPKSLHPGILPSSYKKYIDDSYNFVKKIDTKFTHRYLNHLNDIKNLIGTRRDDRTLPQSYDWFLYQQKLHNKNYWEIFPELEDIFNENSITN